MHVSHKPRVVAAPMPSAVPTLVRLALAVVITAMLLWMFTPTVVKAQEPAGTHQVAVGESLWSLAVRFYGDGRKWTELAKLNDLGSAGEKGLVVRQSIKTPKTTPEPVKPSAIAPPPNTPHNALARARQPQVPTATPVVPAGALASQTAGKLDASPKTVVSASKTANMASSGQQKVDEPTRAVVRPKNETAPVSAEARTEANAGKVAQVSNNMWNIDLASQRDARGKDQATVFMRQTYDAMQTDSAVRSVIRVEKPRMRTGELSAAPFAVEASTAMTSGRVGRRAATMGSIRDIERLILTDAAQITLPAGVTPTIGAQFVSVQIAPIVQGGASVATPTGVLEVIKADAGAPVIARVVRQSGRIEEGQVLMPFGGGAISNAATSTPVARSSGAPETHVVWVEGDALLPTLQSFVLLAATDKDGVKVGDEFALVSRAGVGADAKEQQTAVVRVVRVTAQGSTAIVIKQNDSLIAVGGAARLIAKAN